MTATDSQKLRDLLAAEMHEATADALRTHGEVSPERLDTLGRLARLADMVDAANPPLHQRWGVRLVALGTLIVVSVLLFARMPSTGIAMELKVSELSFVVPTAQPITTEVAVATLGVAGLRAVEVPGSSAGPGASDPATNVYLATQASTGRSGTASLSPITLEAGSRVTLQVLEGQRHYRLTVRGAGSEFGVSVNGPIRLVVPPRLNEVHVFPFPRRIGLEPDSRQQTFDVVVSDTGGSGALRAPLPAESLFLFRVDRFIAPGQTLLRDVSTIDSGVVYFESIEGRVRPLRSGEALHFSASRGELSGLRFTDGGLLLRFEGRVRGMSSGSRDVRRSLMPTVLDWLRSQHGLSLLWGTTAYVVGLFVTVLGWWRRPG